MKLHQALLERLIELPSTAEHELRAVLDDLGLEVKKVELEGGKAVFNIETLANRGDHLSALGIAREISARFLTGIKLPASAGEISTKKVSVPVRNLTDKCLRYALMEMSLPVGMRLRADVAQILGSNPEHHPIVDLLNYVLLEIGQPMHAFDRDKVEGEVVVDLLQSAERVEALDGKTYEVPAGSIVIRDRRRIIAVAGVIGCANTMVTKETTRVLVESATFDPVCVRKTARAMGISTDASYSFERGADPEGVIAGLKRLAHLAAGAGGAVKESEGAHVLGLTQTEVQPLAVRRVTVLLSQFRKELNLARLEEVEVTSRLKNLGYQIESVAIGKSGADRELRFTVPSWRIWDVQNPEDLVEDLARSLSLGRVKLSLPPLDYNLPPPNDFEIASSRIERALLGSGFHEVITKGFYSAEDAELLTRLQPELADRHLTMKNSVERAYSHMKVSNCLHLGRLAEQNHRRGTHTVKVYELGRLFSLKDNSGRVYEFERDVLTLAQSGRWFEHEYKKAELLEECVFLLKGVLESVFRAFGQELVIGESNHALLHPGVQGSLKAGRAILGYFGLLHPELKSALDLSQNLLYAEIEVEEMLRLIKPPEYADLYDLPAIRRDITLKLPLRTLAAKVMRQILEMNHSILEEVSVVDHFKKADEDFRRTTYRLTFRDKKRTLEHSEVDAIMSQLLATLREKYALDLA
ncbi:MAG: phenylalanine--tRNA ligase subunit beta [Oligoflexia bacterium]|nr:phenylalanine--tRNA ligase subunit beta [Oligoflexia bacterium]